MESIRSDAPGSSVGRAVARARAEFLEMPGLRLTPAQARRLWALDAGICDAVLAELLADSFLRRSVGGAYVRNDS
jgi:hypothetical protein